MKNFEFISNKILLIFVVIFWIFIGTVINISDYPNKDFIWNLKFFAVFPTIILSLYFMKKNLKEVHDNILDCLSTCTPLILITLIYILLHRIH